MKSNSVAKGGVTTSRETEHNYNTNPFPINSENKVPDSPHEEIELKNISKMNIEKLKGVSEGYKKQFCDELKKLLENLKTADSVDKIKEYINIFNEALKNDKYTFIASDITNLDDNKLSEKELKNHVNDFTKTANGSLKKYEGNKNFSSFWKSISNIFSAFLSIFKPNALFNAIKNNNVNLVEKLIVKSDKNKIDKALHFAAKQGNAKIINILFEHGADPNHNDKYGNNSLMLAIKNKKINVINKLIEKDVNLNSTNNEGKNALILAVENDLNLDIVGKLIKCGADVNTYDNNGNTPLLVAIKQRNLAIVEALIDASADINMSNNDNLSPLISAFNHKQLDIADKLLELKSSVHEKDINGNTVLMLCINNGGNLETINKLINLGVDKNAKNNRNETATSMAIATGRPEIAKELIEKNAITTNSTSDLDGNTPISLAVQNGYTEIVKQLIDKGVDIKMLSKDKACFHALTNAVAVAQARKDTEIIQFLTDAGFNINSVTKQKDAYEKLIIAIQKGDADTVKRLINTREIDVRLLNEKNHYYKKFINAIKVVLDKGNIDIIQHLSTAGFDMKLLGKDKRLHEVLQKAIIKAIENGEINALKLLVTTGIDINKFELPHDNKESLVSFAVKKGNNEISKIILSLSDKKNIDKINAVERNALMDAAYLGNVEMVDQLLKANAYVNQITSLRIGRLNALHLAVKDPKVDVNDALRIAQMLINHGINKFEVTYHDGYYKNNFADIIAIRARLSKDDNRTLYKLACQHMVPVEPRNRDIYKN